MGVNMGLRLCGISLLLLLSSFKVFAQDTTVYEYKDMTVSVLLSDSETILQGVNRAESLLQINAVTMTPKFVTHTTNYDSLTDEVLEKGVIAQGANVSVANTRYVKELEGDQVRVNVTSDITVDISAMKNKIYSEKREKLMESAIDDLNTDYQKLAAVLEKMKMNIALSTLDSVVVADYYAKLNSTLGMVDGDFVKAQLRAHKEGQTPNAKLQAEMVLAYKQFVMPFLANPIINYQVIDIIPLDYAVAEVKVRVTIDRKASGKEPWYPLEANGAVMANCQKFFFGCDALLRPNQSDVAVELKEVLIPKYCGPSLFEFLPYQYLGDRAFDDEENQIECGRSNRFAFKDPRFYKMKDKQSLLTPEMPLQPEAFNEALQELSRTAYWMQINIGKEKFKVNISNLWLDEITLSAYMPEKEAENGVKISFRVQEEKYDISSLKWSNTAGELLRYQTRRIGFY